MTFVVYLAYLLIFSESSKKQTFILDTSREINFANFHTFMPIVA